MKVGVKDSEAEISMRALVITTYKYANKHLLSRILQGFYGCAVSQFTSLHSKKPEKCNFLCVNKQLPQSVLQ